MPFHPLPTSRRQLLALGAAAAASASLGWPGLAQAQSLTGPLKLTVGFPPGSGPDVVARTLGLRLGEELKLPLAVDNKAGAGGQIAAQTVAKSLPDGNTVLLGEVGSISIAPAAFSKLPYQPLKEFAAISEVVRADFVLVVPMGSPHRSVAEFVKAAKADKDKVNFATFGAGTPGHFGAEVFGELAGFSVESIHYRSTGDAVTAIIAGDVKAAFVSTALAMAQVKGGKVRALATTAKERSPLLPEVPTVVELGWPQLVAENYFGVSGPVGLPKDVTERLARALAEIEADPAILKRFGELGITPVKMSPAGFSAFVAKQVADWGPAIRAADLAP